MISIQVIPNSKLHVSEPNPSWFGNERNPSDPEKAGWTNPNWLQSRFHFSFAEYHKAGNSGYGVLRVMNDDLVQAHRGFGTHPHRNMEIITYIVEGELTHQDSMGTSETLGRGSVQFMTAGTGIQHSEMNAGTKPLRFIQTWIIPSSNGLAPNYGSMAGGSSQPNAWRHLVSHVLNSSVETPVQVNQDVDMFVAELEGGKILVHELPPGRQAYFLCMEGQVTVNGKPLERHDACEIAGSGRLSVEATQVEETEQGPLAHVLLFVMQEVPGSGRTDL